MIVTFIPAAGQSSRMRGRDKLLETIGGEPILTRTARIACEAGLGPVLVGLRPEDKARRKALEGLDVKPIDVSHADVGMSVTLRAGADATLKEIHDAWDATGHYEYLGMMILLPDMPGINADNLVAMDKLHQASGGPVIRATTEDGKPGHPTIIPDNLISKFRDLRGDEGAAQIIKDERTKLLPLPGNRARLDLDTPEEWAAWRAETGIKD